LNEGFRDGTGSYLTDREFSGVWLSDELLTANEGADGDTALCVMLDCAEDEIRQFEWIEEGKGYREFLLPAAFITARGTVTLATSADWLRPEYKNEKREIAGGEGNTPAMTQAFSSWWLYWVGGRSPENDYTNFRQKKCERFPAAETTLQRLIYSWAWFGGSRALHNGWIWKKTHNVFDHRKIGQRFVTIG
jgi:hypothetical protein